MQATCNPSASISVCSKPKYCRVHRQYCAVNRFPWGPIARHINISSCPALRDRRLECQATARRIARGAFSAVRDRRGLPAGNTMLEIDPVPRGYAQQIGRAPDDVILELAGLTVGISQLPHHLDDAESAFLVHRAHDDPGEMIEIDRLALDHILQRDQLIR